MSDAEKQRAIEAIDAETKERIAALTRLQVAEESGLASFEAVNNKLDKEAQGAMKDLEDAQNRMRRPPSLLGWIKWGVYTLSG